MYKYCVFPDDLIVQNSVQKLLANPIVVMLTFREELERVNEEFYDNGTVSYETKKVGFDKIGKN